MRVAKVVIRLVVSFMRICESGKLWGIHSDIGWRGWSDIHERRERHAERPSLLTPLTPSPRPAISACYLLFLRNNHLWECRNVTASSATEPLSAPVATCHPSHPSQTGVTFLHSYLLFLRNTHLWECRFVRPRSALQLLSASTATPHLPSHPLRTLTNLHSYLRF